MADQNIVDVDFDDVWMTKNNIMEIPSDDDIDFPFTPPIGVLHWKPPKDFVYVKIELYF